MELPPSVYRVCFYCSSYCLCFTICGCRQSMRQPQLHIQCVPSLFMFLSHIYSHVMWVMSISWISSTLLSVRARLDSHMFFGLCWHAKCSVMNRNSETIPLLYRLGAISRTKWLCYYKCQGGKMLNGKIQVSALPPPQTTVYQMWNYAVNLIFFGRICPCGGPQLWTIALGQQLDSTMRQFWKHTPKFLYMFCIVLQN